MNNNSQFEKFIRDLNAIKMSDSQKNKMRNNLESFALNYKLKPVQSPYHMALMFRRPFAIAFIILIAIGSTKPVSASALPGEILYPVKIMYEDIEAATKNTSEKKASFKIEQTETRIQEAIKLADNEKLSPEKQDQLALHIKTYTAEIANEIQEIKKENPHKALELTADLKTTLKSNSNALKAVTTTKKKEKETQTYAQVQEPTPAIPQSTENLVSPTTLTKEADSTVVTALPDITTFSPENTVAVPTDEIDNTTLLDSLLLDLIFTETIVNEVKQEIIESLDEKPFTTGGEEANTPIALPVTPIETSNTIIQDATLSTTPADTGIIDLGESVEIHTDTSSVTVPSDDTLTNGELSFTELSLITKERINKEITALDQVSDLKNRLESLETKYMIERTVDEKDAVDTQLHIFINKGQYGQAIIYLQSKIDLINEAQQVLKIEGDLGISNSQHISNTQTPADTTYDI
jgi:hypothetical protein